MRFILIAFALMALAFYELSGGSDFDADAVRAERMAKLDLDEPIVLEADTAAAISAPVVISEAPQVVVDTDPPETAEITQVSLNLTTLDSAENAATETAAADVPQNLGNVTSSEDTPAIIPSLINPNDGVTTAEPVQETTQVVGFQDIRTVSGSRVNVRGGPGTDFGIVGRLDRGDEVVILEDNGAGWVRFEATDGATSGWLADFLLNNG